MKPALHEDRGITLIEMLVYLSICAVVLNLCAVTFVNTTRMASLTSERAMRQQAFAQFSQDFARTVHGASRVVPSVGSATTNASQVILATPNGPVVIGVAGKVLAIWTLDDGPNGPSIGRITTYPVAFSAVQFEIIASAGGEARSIAVHITGPARKDPDDHANNRDLVATMRASGGAP